jgi:endonuclease/exonuclease/phosphatase family metal-dependent hydrolase
MSDMGIASSTPRVALPSFRVLTYNIWFDRQHMAERMQSVLAILEESNADFLCLQEVTDASMKLVESAAFVTAADGYDVSPLSRHSEGYFTLLLVRKKLRAVFTRTRLPTRMGRDLCTAVVRVSAEDGAHAVQLLVSTSHFESLSSRDIREQQLGVAAEHLRPRADAVDASASADGHYVILCGDFNFCSERDFGKAAPATPEQMAALENNVLARQLPSFIDCWPHVKRDDPTDRGYTFDSTRNDVIVKFERMRYDRILAGGSRYRPVHIELIGTEPVPSAVYDDRVLVPFRPSKHRPIDASSTSTNAALLNARSSLKPTATRVTQRDGSITIDNGVRATAGSAAASADSSDASSDDQSGDDEDTPRCGTPPRKVRRVFPSDHFGIVCDFVWA